MSNGPFDQLELRSWQQVLEVCGKPLPTSNQLKAKHEQLKKAQNYQYSEAEVTKGIEEKRKASAAEGRVPAQTTRQKMMEKHAGAGGAGGMGGIARPKKFERDVLGRAFVAEHDDA